MARGGTLVAARRLDGSVVKGRCTNFQPGVEQFDVWVTGDASVRVAISELKALFFVKSLEGNPKHEESKEFRYEGSPETRTWVEFTDGEELAGWSPSESEDPTGFYLLPTDAASNLEQVFVFRSAVRQTYRGRETEDAAERYRRKKKRRGTPDRWDTFVRQF